MYIIVTVQKPIPRSQIMVNLLETSVYGNYPSIVANGLAMIVLLFSRAANFFPFQDQVCDIRQLFRRLVIMLIAARSSSIEYIVHFKFFSFHDYVSHVERIPPLSYRYVRRGRVDGSEIITNLLFQGRKILFKCMDSFLCRRTTTAFHHILEPSRN